MAFSLVWRVVSLFTFYVSISIVTPRFTVLSCLVLSLINFFFNQRKTTPVCLVIGGSVIIFFFAPNIHVSYPNRKGYPNTAVHSPIQ